jgi:Asp-tRNA(Asn)/Glu-tRNA(Gln) amidotransferase A subunit family amidase
MSIAELSRQLEIGAVRSEDVVRACLERIASRDKEIGAWAHLDPEYAIEEAQARDREPRRSRLHGIPIGVKDIFDTRDMPTACGSPIYHERRPADDAAVVAALRDAGAIVMGKTVTTEFAALHPSATRNPHNPEHTPGGSSSGSAAAVADLMVPAALGTQTMGSIIRPASFCGVIGYKPSFGLLPCAGVKAQAPSCDTVGFFTRTMEDVPLVLAALRPCRKLDFGQESRHRPRIGVCRGPGWEKAASETAEALEGAATALVRAGSDVVEVDPSRVLEDALEAARIVVSYEMTLSLAYEYAVHRDRLSSALRSFLDEASRIGEREYRHALSVAETARAWLENWFESIDAILSPATPGEAPRGLGFTGDTVFNRGWTLLHVPCLTFPAGSGRNGLPLGLQLIGPLHADERLIAAATWVEASVTSRVEPGALARRANA